MSLTFDVPDVWAENVEGYIALLTMQLRPLGHQPVSYYVEEE